MKSSLGKLRKFAHLKSDAKEKRLHLPKAHLDELAQASLDMQDMRDCYDSLLSAAAATANSAFEFSESLRDMGNCLLTKSSLNSDEESGRVLSLLGQVQFELQKLVDNYRSHILLTITKPSESLLSELQIVEGMKHQCDEKRNLYEHKLGQHQEKGRLKSGKGESVNLQQLQEAREDFDQEATLCVFRLKSLKQGQCRSLLTQAARHHAAQLNFFRKGHKSLEEVDPQIKFITEKHHIDYELNGLDDGGNVEGGAVFNYEDDGELSFDYRLDKQYSITIPKHSLDLDEVVLPCPQASTVENSEANVDSNKGEHVLSRKHRAGSHSAPIFADKKLDPAERIRDNMQTNPARNFHSYVLPTPVDAKITIPSKPSNSGLYMRPTGISGSSKNLWNSSPLEHEKHVREVDINSSVPPGSSTAHSVFRESNNDKVSIQIPPPLADGLSVPQCDSRNPFDSKKVKRHAFSGPLTAKPPYTTKPLVSASGPITPSELPQLVSGLNNHQRSSSPKVSPCASPPLETSPKISELHELPRPPPPAFSKPSSSSSTTGGYSAPLVFRNQETSTTSRSSFAASPLPAPPLSIPRSFSIPTRNQRTVALHVANLLQTQVPDKPDKVASPPLTPVSLSKR